MESPTERVTMKITCLPGGLAPHLSPTNIFDVLRNSEFGPEGTALWHGVNCHGVMGGLAGQFYEEFPDSSDFYIKAAKAGALIPGASFCVPASKREQENHNVGTICHIISQEQPGQNATVENLVKGVRDAANHCGDRGIKRVATPGIGSGIGGLTHEQSVYAIGAGIASSRHPNLSVTLVGYSEEDVQALREAVQTYFDNDGHVGREV